MNRLVKLVVLSVLACAAVPESLHAQDATAVALDRIYREYGAQKGATDVAVLVRLDQQLRNLVPYYTWQNRPWLSANYFDTKYKEIGLAPALFEPSVLTYSGKLLLEAHTKNARSPLRSSTLYSTVFGAAGETSNGLPSTSDHLSFMRIWDSLTSTTISTK
jgi:hypothetical protein